MLCESQTHSVYDCRRLKETTKSKYQAGTKNYFDFFLLTKLLKTIHQFYKIGADLRSFCFLITAEESSSRFSLLFKRRRLITRREKMNS